MVLRGMVVELSALGDIDNESGGAQMEDEGPWGSADTLHVLFSLQLFSGLSKSDTSLWCYLWGSVPEEIEEVNKRSKKLRITTT